MPTGDSRKDHLLQTVSNHFDLQVSDESIGRLQSDTALNSFLDDGNIMSLSATRVGSDIKLSNKVTANNTLHAVHSTIIIGLQVEIGGQNEQSLVFYKLQPCVITPDNVHSNVLTSTMTGSPVSALYHSVQKVFAPLLLKVKVLLVLECLY